MSYEGDPGSGILHTNANPNPQPRSQPCLLASFGFRLNLPRFHHPPCPPLLLPSRFVWALLPFAPHSQPSMWGRFVPPILSNCGMYSVRFRLASSERRIARQETQGAETRERGGALWGRPRWGGSWAGAGWGGWEQGVRMWREGAV